MLDLQDAGLAPGLFERALGWWKRFGGRRAAMLTVAVTLPLVRYEYIPYVLSSTVETLAEGYGLDLTVDEWETSFSDIKVIARNVAVTTTGPYREKRLFRARAVEFDWSLTRALANGYARVTGCWTAVFGRTCTLPDEIFHRITLDGASLHMERSLAGAWNAQDAFHVETLDALAGAVGRWRIPVIQADELSLSWVEHLPGESGAGLVEQRFSHLDVSKVTLGISNLQVPVDDRPNATRVTFDGRTADGQVSMVGQVNVSRWEGGAWAPSYDVTVRLVNVGAATVARFSAPDASVVPRSGLVDGTIRLARDGPRTTACRIDVALRDVTYAANPRSPYVRVTGAALDDELRALRVSEVVSRDCTQTMAPGGEPRRVSETVQTMVTTDALDQAPPLVRGAAGFDESSVVDGRVPTPEEITAELSEQLGLAIGGQRGAAVAKALTSSGDSRGNAVTRGARSVGRGIRRLFGGGDSKPAAKRPGR